MNAFPWRVLAEKSECGMIRVYDVIDFDFLRLPMSHSAFPLCVGASTAIILDQALHISEYYSLKRHPS